MSETVDNGTIREFGTGATRNTAEEKPDYEGYLNPLVIEAFGKYMLKHQKQTDGSMRGSDNWQNLFGEKHFDVCIKSLWRHFLDLWREHRGYKSREGLDNALNGILFNTMAYYYKILRDREENKNV